LTAAATRRDEAKRDPIPCGDAIDSFADGFHHTGTLVSKDRRKSMSTEVTKGQVIIGMADACRRDLHQDLVMPRRIE
jgi:hypothetical protein